MNRKISTKIIKRTKSTLHAVIDIATEMTVAKYDGHILDKQLQKWEQYGLISFDVFDTLLLRPFAKPTDLFWTLERKNGIEGFHDKRIRAEEQARQESGKEVNLQEIYEEFVRNISGTPEGRKLLNGICGKTDEGNHLTEKDQDEIVRRLMGMEYDEEMRQCYANTDLKKLYRYFKKKGIRMIAVSDMYLSEQQIGKLLRENGFGSIKKIYVSCDRGVGKHRGRLLKIVKELEKNRAKQGQRPIRMMHIGDNLHADIEGGLMGGWDVLWYRRMR